MLARATAAATDLLVALLRVTRWVTIVVAAMALTVAACTPMTAVVGPPETDPAPSEEAEEADESDQHSDEPDADAPDAPEDPGDDEPDEPPDAPPRPPGPPRGQDCSNALPPGPC